MSVKKEYFTSLNHAVFAQTLPAGRQGTPSFR